jgi:hypothetical protein
MLAFIKEKTNVFSSIRETITGSDPAGMVFHILKSGVFTCIPDHSKRIQ